MMMKRFLSAILLASLLLFSTGNVSAAESNDQEVATDQEPFSTYYITSDPGGGVRP
jgi:hypothetical protein